MDILLTLILPHVMIGTVLCFIEWVAAAMATKGGWLAWPARLIPIVALMCWAALLAYGAHNNPTGGGLLLLVVGGPMLVFGGAGLALGYLLGNRGR